MLNEPDVSIKSRIQCAPGPIKGVQCESCHGPMGGHPDDATVVSATVDMEACVGCHDPANSPGFAWESYLRRSVCQDLSTPAVPEEP